MMKYRLLGPIIHPIKELSESGKLGGVLLIIATIFSISITNSSYSERYLHFWHQEIGNGFISMPLEHWINDLLMAAFFFLVGLEIKRELVTGELSSPKKVLLPLLAALGGMLFPALIFFAFNAGSENIHGWAIPTATDIAFSLGVLSLLGKRVPLSLKVFLTALAIIDDLGGILIIAVFYTNEIHTNYLLLSIGIIAILFLLNKFNVNHFIFYFIPIIFLWYCIYRSGVHATIAGVVSAFFIPINRVEKYEHILHQPVNYFILPIFALANTTIVLSAESIPHIFSDLGIGIILALFVGKTVGISSLVFISIKTKICELPNDILFKHIIGVALLAGIGFTMSLFFTALSFKHPESSNIARLAIIIGSTLSAICGVVFLSFSLKEA
ncbi:MAG: Na+/H+ antiporter NhaA [Chitinophagales bacterium]